MNYYIVEDLIIHLNPYSAVNVLLMVVSTPKTRKGS